MVRKLRILEPLESPFTAPYEPYPRTPTNSAGHARASRRDIGTISDPQDRRTQIYSDHEVATPLRGAAFSLGTARLVGGLTPTDPPADDAGSRSSRNLPALCYTYRSTYCGTTRAMRDGGISRISSDRCPADSPKAWKGTSAYKRLRSRVAFFQGLRSPTGPGPSPSHESEASTTNQAEPLPWRHE
jgi:hypothetical protein